MIVAGPTRPLRPGDADKLQRYLERGGALLVLVDPRAQTDFGEPLAKWGVTVGDDVIVDRVQGIFGQAMSPLAGEYAEPRDHARHARSDDLPDGARPRDRTEARQAFTRS